MRGDGPVRVNMIGPAPRHWGGGGRWPGGGIASHVAGLLPALPAQDVVVRLLADNVPAGKAPPLAHLPPNIELDPVAPSPRSLRSFCRARALSLAFRSVRNPEIRRAAPPVQLMRFWAQAVYYDISLMHHPAELIHVHRAFHRQFLCQQLIETTQPVIVTAHSVNPLLEPGPPWVSDLFTSNYRRADQMIAVSSYVKERVVGFGADAEKVTVITNGVDIERFTPGLRAVARQKLDLPVDAPILLFSGNLIARKGVDILLHAFAQVVHDAPDARLIILGTGPEERRLVELAQELHVHEQVHFLGARPFGEMPLWYRACDVYVLPSRSEGLSMAVLEAMSTGRPVVTTRPDVGEHDAVLDSKTGRLTDYGNVQELARAMRQLLCSAEMAQEMGDAARARAKARFDWTLIGRQTAELYRSVLQHHDTLPTVLDR